MEKRVRKGYGGDRYPTLREGLDRRGFLARLGAASGLVVLGGVNLAGRSLGSTIYEEQGNRFIVLFPTSGELRPFQTQDSTPQQIHYQVYATVDEEGLAICLEQREDLLLPDLDVVVSDYSYNAYSQANSLTAIENRLLEVLKAHCVAPGEGDDDTGSAGDDDDSAGDDDTGSAGDDDSADGRSHHESDQGYVAVELFVDLDPYADDYGATGGCSCSSVPWRDRRRSRR